MNDVTLKEYIETQIKWLDRHFAVQLEAIKIAGVTASEQLSERLARMNEIREAMKDQAANYATKAELELKLDSINGRISALELSKANTDGKTVILSTLASILVAALAHWIFK